MTAVHMDEVLENLFILEDVIYHVLYISAIM